jgi:hypothetical protein
MVKFYEKLGNEMIEAGNKTWLIFRSTLNHLMMILNLKPYFLNLGFSPFVA